MQTMQVAQRWAERSFVLRVLEESMCPGIRLLYSMEVSSPKLNITIMKVTDLNTIQAIATEQLENYGGGILDFLTMEDAANCLTMIYVTNDLTSGFGQDFANNISVVSSQTRIAIIGFGRHSFYKVTEPICGYESIADDMRAINVTLDAALARWEDNRL